MSIIRRFHCIHLLRVIMYVQSKGRLHGYVHLLAKGKPSDVIVLVFFQARQHPSVNLQQRGPESSPLPNQECRGRQPHRKITCKSTVKHRLKGHFEIAVIE